MPKKLSPLLKGFAAALRPADRRPPWLWCEDHLVVDDTSPLPGRWRSDNSPWVREVMEEAVKRRRVAVKCSAQSAKTQTVLGLACYAISEDPGPALWVMAAKDEAKDFLRDRVLPTFHNCRPVRSMHLGNDGLTMSFASMPFYFTGAGSKSKLQSKPIRWLFLDEVRNYPDGALEMALKRTRSFWNAHEFIISTPDMVNDDVDMEFKAGDQRSFHIECPGCGGWVPYTFDGLKWDDNETTRPGGKWHFDALADTIRFECPQCHHAWPDMPHIRRGLAKGGKFFAKNPNAPKSRVSFEWEAVLPPWVPWRSIVEEYLNALKAARADPPDLEPLKSFYNETRGLSWESALGIVDSFEFLDARKQDYDFNDPWPEEVTRFMAADKQAKGGDHYWWVVRAFGKHGKSRLISYGRANTYDDLEQVRKDYGVKLVNAMIDTGYRASEVYRFCQKLGWKAFKGDNTDAYTHTIPDPQNPSKTRVVRRIWMRSHVDPAFGTRMQGKVHLIPLYRFSGESTKDFHAEFMRGLVGDWTLPAGVGPDYLQQVTAEVRIAVEDTKGRIRYEWRQTRPDNHLLDCELMILIAAVISKLVQGGTVRTPKALPKSA